jgi:hypothetical protein
LYKGVSLKTRSEKSKMVDLEPKSRRSKWSGQATDTSAGDAPSPRSLTSVGGPAVLGQGVGQGYFNGSWLFGLNGTGGTVTSCLLRNPLESYY